MEDDSWQELFETPTFIEHAQFEVERLYSLSDQARRTLAGDQDTGVQYFRDLFSDDPHISQIDQLTSIYTGSIAFGREDLAKQAYHYLALTGFGEGLHQRLIDRLDGAIALERKHGDFNRLERLEKATKELGKPLLQRIANFLLAYVVS